MARHWREVRADAAERLDEQAVTEARKSMQEEVRAYRLAEIRREQGWTRQEDVADLMGISQSRVSKIERGDLRHTELGTLESYVRALGGHLRVVAEFGDRSLTLG
ncbi:helix-turn-helix transcriptional regulator (plasmid) [Rhodococcus ruber]|uniref:helix-turn-helix domain-containing protein n=1 Tax=Rhodococcus TaxID=1827 RepID=UPI001124B015|nr:MULTISPECIES: helix-turn-helix transcriptional regulator [Rhodococcus]QDC17478.1 helix-turn-helix domain-containing protein [Rhodococcus ruber]QRE83782.1 helix-turn-helix transcriptional regulator [Rhodococcus ruber]WKX02121.1 helix-turn-helix transcriptional regulator [Rhodococcus aetherivorans]